MKHKIKFTAVLLLISALLTLGASAYAKEASGSGLGAGCELVKGGLVGEELRFLKSDFEAALGTARLGGITVKTLPEASTGKLFLNGREVKAGDRIRGENLSKLTFRAASDTVTEASFTFRAEGASVSDTLCKIRFTETLNRAPSVGHLTEEWLTVSTQCELPISGRLSAYDPEGDALCYFVSAYPKNGTLVLDRSGEYLYRPSKSFTGSDGFSYVVRDALGNYSEEASVQISVSARAASYEYRDLEMGTVYASALSMEAQGIMQGRILGDERYFDPDESVSLGDFVVMAMKAGAERPIASETFFDNNSEIHTALRGYIAAAQRKGYIIGCFEDGKLLFPHTETVTRAEAALIVSRILGVKGGETVTVFADADSIPSRAASAVYTLHDLGILPAEDGETIAANEPLTRGVCAQMLAAMIEYLS